MSSRTLRKIFYSLVAVFVLSSAWMAIELRDISARIEHVGCELDNRDNLYMAEYRRIQDSLIDCCIWDIIEEAYQKELGQ